jgi:transposase
VGAGRCLAVVDGTLAGAPASGAGDRLGTRAGGRLAGEREKGGAATGASPADRGRPSSKLHLCCDARGVPLSVSVSAGNENERRQLLALVDAIPALRANGNSNRPDRLLADRGYDSHSLRAALRARGIEPSIPGRRGRGQGGSPDPQLKQRWTIERTNAWLHNYRRIHNRWERRPELYQALLQLACSLIICRRLAGAF